MFPPPIQSVSGFWNSKNFKVFITHISKHKSPAEKLQKALIPYSISSFVAHTDIEPTREWENEILNALNASDGLVALLHKGFHESKWTDQEIGIGVGRGLLVLSVSFGESPYGFIGRYQALQGMGKSYDQLAREIYRIFLTHRLSRRRITETIVNKFVESTSFDHAKRNMELLKTVEYWDDNFTKIARKAIKDNDQLSGAWGVPEALENHINKWKADSIPF